MLIEQIDEMIRTIRGVRVMLDRDLAKIYGVETRVLVQAIKRNRDRFPPDFVIHLSGQEWESLRSQTVISKAKGGTRYLPFAFTEHGALQAANVLRSPRGSNERVRYPRLRENARSAARHARTRAETRFTREKAHRPIRRARSGDRRGLTGSNANSQSAATARATAETDRLSSIAPAPALPSTLNWLFAAP